MSVKELIFSQEFACGERERVERMWSIWFSQLGKVSLNS